MRRLVVPVVLSLSLLLPRVGSAVEIVAPDELLHDADLPLRITGLAPESTIRLRSEFAGHGGSVWRSIATFTADASGTVDPATTAPVAGSWTTADPRAFVWAMEKTNELASSTAILENEDRSIVSVAVLAGDSTLAEKRITLWKRAAGVSTTEIRGPLVGAFCVPYGRTRLPAVIVLGGSEGGLARDRAALLASHGFAALALAYFGMPGLPAELDRIPVETVSRAVAWLRAQPMVDPKAIAVYGGSKGAELALLAAAHDPAIRAVVAFAPASVVFASITNGRVSSSSWTLGGRELPWAPYVSTDEFKKSYRLVDLYVPTLAAAPAAAAIPVEDVHGAILLVSGKDDALWPSATMAAQLVERAKQKGSRVAITNLVIDDAGHHVAGMPNRPPGDSVRLGGSAAGLAAAQSKSWREILAFLDRSLRHH